MTDPRPPLRAVPDDVDGTRTPPYNRDYERWTLGVAMTRPDHIDDLRATGLTGTVFYRPIHELTWSAILTLHVQGKPTDIVTVHDELERRGALTKPILRALGEPPMAYLAALVADAPPAANGTYYADQLVNLAATRRHLTLATRITEHPDDALDLIREHLEYEGAQPGAGEQANSWAPVDLAAIRANGEPRPTATLLVKTDGTGLLYPSSVHTVAGEPTSGKSWIALVGTAQEIAEGHPVLYVDFEDRAETLVARLDDLGANPDDVDRLVRYIRPEVALNPANAQLLDQAAQDCRLAVVDGVTEAMSMHGLDLSSNPDVATWLELLPRRLANHGPAVLQIDHVVKDAESRGRYAIGGQHKLAGIVASYTMLVAKPFAIGRAGHARLVVAKDRHGNVGTVGQTVAELHMTPDAARTPTALDWSLTGSTYTATPDGKPRRTWYMEKVSRFIEGIPGATQKTIVDGINGKDKYIVEAIQTLIDEGFITVDKGERGAHCHRQITPFRQDEDETP